MKRIIESRRRFLQSSGLAAGGLLLSPRHLIASQADDASPDYTLHIEAASIEIGRNHNLSTITYNGQFPGPLLRFKEGQKVTIEIYNDTGTPEQLHWHGQRVSADVDGAAEEGTPFIPAHGKRRISFTPSPAGFRFYHTHNRAGANLSAGQYSGQVGAVYIEPKKRAGPARPRSLSRSQRVCPESQSWRRHPSRFPLTLRRRQSS
jgi:FtsP/CotA-like multicopper oxidase with cupredoxin domain